MKVSIESLRLGLTTLPQELYNQIHTSVFTAPQKDQWILGWIGYQPPKLLSISHSSREQFATSYYSNSFRSAAQSEPILRWLKSLPQHHRALIPKVTVSGHPAHILSDWGRCMPQSYGRRVPSTATVALRDLVRWRVDRETAKRVFHYERDDV